jgi:hypothetical protein
MDINNPKPIPSQLHLTPSLAIYLVKQLPSTVDITALENTVLTINKAFTCNNTKKMGRYNKDRTSGGGHKNKYKVVYKSLGKIDE